MVLVAILVKGFELLRSINPSFYNKIGHRTPCPFGIHRNRFELPVFMLLKHRGYNVGVQPFGIYGPKVLLRCQIDQRWVFLLP